MTHSGRLHPGTEYRHPKFMTNKPFEAFLTFQRAEGNVANESMLKIKTHHVIRVLLNNCEKRAGFTLAIKFLKHVSK